MQTAVQEAARPTSHRSLATIEIRCPAERAPDKIGDPTPEVVMHGRRLLWVLPALSLTTCAPETDGQQLEAMPGYVVLGELPDGIDIDEVLAQIPPGGFGVVGNPSTGEVATIVPTSSNSPEIVSSHFSVTDPAACTDCGISCDDTLMRTIAIGLTQTSGPEGSPIRVQTHSSMNFAAPQHSPSSWISSVGSNVTISTVGTLGTCATFSYYFDIVECGDDDDCVECNPEDTQDVSCGLNGNGTRPQVCVDGAWEDDGPCDDPDECVNGIESSTEACTWVCVDGRWSGCGFVEVGAGHVHNCALRESGAVACWGRGLYGRLGNGSTSDSSLPVAVSNLTDAVAVSAGSGHSCALRETGEVVCWGLGDRGQLGNGSTSDSSEPVTVSNLDDVVVLSAGSFHTCALRETGAVMCWGENEYGKLGDGSTSDSSVPVTVLNLSDPVALGAGGTHSCALVDTSAVCWGRGNLGQLGNGLTSDSPVPVSVSNLSDAVAVSLGQQHSCALRETAAVACWGSNTAGQLGSGSNLQSSSVPVTVLNLDNAVEVSAGTWHNCALRETGAAACWGMGGFGQLGNGSTLDRNQPVPVTDLDDAVAVRAGGLHSCAMRETGSVACWGNNSYGQLGDGSTSDTTIPVTVFNEGPGCGQPACQPGFNYDFENWTESDPPSGFWKSFLANYTVSEENADVNTGNAAARVTTSAGTNNRALQAHMANWIPATPGTTYTLHQWNQFLGPWGWYRAGLTFMDADDNWIDPRHFGPIIDDIDGAWRESTVTATAPAEAVHIKPFLRTLHRRSTEPPDADPSVTLTDDWAVTVPYVFDVTHTARDGADLDVAIAEPLWIGAAINDAGVLYVSTNGAAGGNDRFLYVWIGGVGAGMVPAPWAKAGTVIGPADDGHLLALIQEENSGFCEWRIYDPVLQWVALNTEVTCSSNLGDVLSGTFEVAAALGMAPHEVATFVGFAAAAYGTNDGAPLVAQLPTGNEDANVDAAETQPVHRARLLVGKIHN
jgi:alpha-tubulin suppressor-like RCC1 family protein